MKQKSPAACVKPDTRTVPDYLLDIMSPCHTNPTTFLETSSDWPRGPPTSGDGSTIEPTVTIRKSVPKWPVAFQSRKRIRRKSRILRSRQLVRIGRSHSPQGRLQPDIVNNRVGHLVNAADSEGGLSQAKPVGMPGMRLSQGWQWQRQSSGKISAASKVSLLFPYVILP